MATRADITENKILSDYEYALKLAKEQEKPDSIVSAATAQAKLVGMLKDKIEHSTSLDDANSVSEILEIVAREVGSEAALALGRAFNALDTASSFIDLADMDTQGRS